MQRINNDDLLIGAAATGRAWPRPRPARRTLGLLALRPHPVVLSSHQRLTCRRDRLGPRHAHSHGSTSGGCLSHISVSHIINQLPCSIRN